MKRDQKYYAIIVWIRKIINVYFGQFLVFYFFTVANYNLTPISFYYIFEYAFLAIGFFVIRNAIKSHIRIPYYRLGLAIQALYLSSIMILKEHIIYFAPIVGMIYGMGEGFFYFPNNIMYSNIVSKENRKHFEGIMNVVSNIISIVVPFIIGYLLTFFDYVNVAKIFFVFIVLAFFLSYSFSDTAYEVKKCESKKFFQIVLKDKRWRYFFALFCLSGFTFSSGALSLVVTVYTIFEYQTTLNLGILTSIFALLTCGVSYYFANHMKEHNFKKYVVGCSLLSGISIFLFGFMPSKITIILYNFMNAICLHLLNLILNVLTNHVANQKEIKKFETEYFLTRDLLFGFSRVTSYIFVLIVTFFFQLHALKYTLFLISFCIFFFGLVMYYFIKNYNNN